jgi:ribosomal-protein-alanine N-acetyltransferase
LLRELEINDAKELLNFWSNHEVIKYTYFNCINTIEESEKRVQWFIDKIKTAENIGPYMIIEKGTVLGLIGACLKSEVLGEYEIFYLLGKQFWGKGYATESVLAIINYLFERPEVERITADVVTENLASWHLLQKVGMQREGCLRRKFYNGDSFHDLYVYSILRNEWEKNKINAKY